MKKKNKVNKINNLKNYSNSVKEEVKTVHFNKWWDNKWQVVQEKKSGLRKSTQISIRSYKNSKQPKLNKSYNHKLVHTLRVWCHLLKMEILINFNNRIKNQIHWPINNQRKIMIVVQIGEKENFMMIMTINNIILSKIYKKVKINWHHKLVKSKSMKVDKEKTKKGKRKLLYNPILEYKNHWFQKMILLWENCIADFN